MLLGIHLVLVDLFSSKHRNHGSFVFVQFVNPLREITQTPGSSGTFQTRGFKCLSVQRDGREDIANLRQECHNSKFGIFGLLV